MRRNPSMLLLASLLVILLVSCGTPSATSTPAASTATATSRPPTATLTPSQTSESPTLTPTATIAPVDGFLLAKVYIRSGPGTNFDDLGLLNQSQTVQLIGKDISGEWYQVLYPSSPSGSGWIVARYVQAADTERLPVIGLVTAGGDKANTAQVVQRLNVRAGPGLSYAVLGMVDPPATLLMTGRNQLGNWIQVEYKESPSGFGWVAVAYIRLTEKLNLPILDESGTPIPATPEGTFVSLPTPTPTIGPAFWDNDAVGSPGGKVVFSPLGVWYFTYTSDISAPQGDPDDWLVFTPHGSLGGALATLRTSLACSGNGTLKMTLTEGDVLISEWDRLACGDRDVELQLPGGKEYLLHLSLEIGNELQFVHYTLTIQNLP